MKKALIVFLASLGLAGALYGAYEAGKQEVINNQVIYDESGNEGFYYSEYNGNLYKYWFEK